MAAKLRFALGVVNKSATINGKDAGTGFLVVELDDTVNVKSLFKTAYLFDMGDVREAVQNGKDLTITTQSGDVIELRAKPDDLESLVRLIRSVAKKKEAA